MIWKSSYYKLKIYTCVFASLTSTVQGLVQQVEHLTGQDRYQAVLMDKTTDQTKDQTNVKGTTHANVKEGMFL